MATVLHIDGLDWRTEARSFMVEPGTSPRDLFRDLGATVRIEEIEMPPRTLSPEAEQFIRDYKREDPGTVLAVYWRYHSLDAEEFDTVEEAGQYLERSAEREELAGEAIVDGDRIIVCE